MRSVCEGIGMPAPASVDELLDLIRKSNIVDIKRLDTAVDQARASGAMPTEPAAMGNLLVSKAVLTKFQSEQFLQGKWKRFTIGNYKVLERIGSGGMGNVFLCEHKVMRRRVAIKVLATVVADDPAGLKRFQREARAAAALDHPHIVRAHDIGQEEKLHYLVMDYVDGTSLQDILKKFGRMDIVRAAHYIKQAAAGLQHAHEAGLVHRDIKPANLILDRAGTVKVLDMGIARFSESDEEVLTRGPLGTADYLAPEQARDSHNVDPRADIYSLGATFYTMLTGRLPFADAKTVAQKLIYLQSKQPIPIRTLRPEVPEGIVAVVDKLMAKDPAQRYQNLNDLIRDLEPFTSHAIAPPPDREMPELSPALLPSAHGDSSGAVDLNLKTPCPAPPTSRSSGLLVGAVVVVLLAAVGVWVWWTYLRPTQ